MTTQCQTVLKLLIASKLLVQINLDLAGPEQARAAGLLHPRGIAGAAAQMSQSDLGPTPGGSSSTHFRQSSGLSPSESRKKIEKLERQNKELSLELKSKGARRLWHCPAPSSGPTTRL